MRPFVFSLMLSLIVAAAAPARAEPPPKDAESPGQLLGEAGEKLMRALDLMIKVIPQYEAPEVLENGDIIIRRKNREPLPKATPAPADKPRGERTET